MKLESIVFDSKVVFHNSDIEISNMFRVFIFSKGVSEFKKESCLFLQTGDAGIFEMDENPR